MTRESAQRSGFPCSGPGRFLILAVLALGLTAWSVHRSGQIGRLCTAPVYDDCSYFWNGVALLEAVRDHGLAGVPQHIATYGLHSPYSDFLAAGAFAAFGPGEASPYWANGFILLLYLCLVTVSLRNLPFGAWLAALVIFMAIPFATMIVAEFRPDLCWAFITGFGAVRVLSDRRFPFAKGSAAVIGLCFALSLLTKPSTFVMTCILYGLAAFVRFVEMVKNGELRNGGWRRFLAGLAVAFCVAAIVAGPYVYYFWRDIWGYFWDNSFGINRQVWLHRGDAWEQITFYLWGMGGQSNIGFSGFVMLAVFVAGGCCLWFRRPDLRLKLAGVCLLVAAAFAVNTIAQMKSAFLGGGIYGCAIFATAFVLNELFADGGIPVKRLACALALLALVAALAYRWPRFCNVALDGLRPKSFRCAEDGFEKFLESRRDSLPKNILFMQAGPVVMEDVAVWSLRHHAGIDVASGAFLKQADAFRETCHKFDWIVLQPTGTLGTCDIMPSEPHLGEFLSAISSDAGYRKIGEIKGVDGNSVYIFQRIPDRS